VFCIRIHVKTADSASDFVALSGVLYFTVSANRDVSFLGVSASALSITAVPTRRPVLQVRADQPGAHD
jgi:hypothetical protein